MDKDTPIRSRETFLSTVSDAVCVLRTQKNVIIERRDARWKVEVASSWYWITDDVFHECLTGNWLVYVDHCRYHVSRLCLHLADAWSDIPNLAPA